MRTWSYWQKIGGTVLAAVLYALAFPKFYFFALAWVALVPLIWIGRSESPWKAWGYGWLFGFLSMGLENYGMIQAIMEGRLSLFWGVSLALLLWTLYGLQAGFFCMTLSAIRPLKGFPETLLIAAAWTAMEYARVLLTPAVPYILLGYTLGAHPAFIQIASWTGCYGVSFLIAYGNAAAASGRWRIIASAALLTVGVYAFGAHGILKNPVLAKENGTPVAILQGNIDPFIPWTLSKIENVKLTYEGLVQESLKENPAILIWPENAMPGYVLEDRPLKAWFDKVLRRSGVPQVVGGTRRAGKEIRNASIAFDTQGHVLGIYDKQDLMIWGETLPQWLKQTWQPLVHFGQYSPGSGSRTVTVNGLRFGVTLCSESYNPRSSRLAVREGGDVLLNQTNDGWFLNSSLPYQHILSSLFRAVELDRWMVIAANTGISAVVDPQGRLQSVTRLMEKTVLRGWIQARSTRTLYARFGDWFPQLCLLICLFTWIRTRPRSKARRA